ncbi:MAG: T9SS type A sorting domain-containing protein [Bacteroidales bacterium]
MSKINFRWTKIYKYLVFTSIFTLSLIQGWGQTTLVQWNFPNNPDDATVDVAIAANGAKTIALVNADATISFSRAGVTTSCASSLRWDNGAGVKSFEFNDIVTSGYSSITFSASMSGGNNNSPRDFQVQYRYNNGTWTDIGSAITLSTAWTIEANNLSLPSANNQADVDIRIIQTSNTSIGGGGIGTGGGAWVGIDNIILSGIPVFYSSGTADATNVNSWWTNTDGTGSHPSDFTSNYQTFIIQTGDNYTTTSNWTVSGTNSSILVQSGATFNCGTFTTNGTANFTLSSGANILTQHAQGLSTTAATGSIQVTGTKIFNSGANYTYNGTVAQVTGNGLPATVNNLTIDNTNAGGVTLSGNVTVSAILDYAQGPFVLNGRSLTLNGTVTRSGAATGTISGSTTSIISIAGTGALGTLYFTSGSENLLNLIIDRTASGTIGLGTPLTIGTSSTGTLTLTNGIVQSASNLITVANVAQAAVSGGSANSFINGSLKRALPSSTSGASTFSFPVGEGGVYKNLDLLNIVTGSGAVDATVTVSSTGATNPVSGISPLLSERNWYVNKTGNLTSAFVRITESGMTSSNLLGISTAAQSGPYSSAGGVGGSTITSASAITTLPAWFAIGTLNLKTYYSYQDGSWTDPATWTLDPSGTLQIGTGIPSDGDSVVILSGRTVVLPGDVGNTGLDVNIQSGGVLDLSTYTFISPLSNLLGQGTLKLSSASFPSVTTNTFINTGGGTTEYYNSADFNLSSTQSTYNNLTFNLSTGITATQLNNLTLNGNLHVKKGTFRINNNTAITKLNLTIEGSVTVDNGAFITVGNGTTNPAIGGVVAGGTAPFLNYYEYFHKVVIKGDFTNNGSVKFTNLAYPDYNDFPPTGSLATSGAASVYFQGTTDNTITLNGVTDFYNLIIDKGVDQTYSVTLNSSAYANFRLFGANSIAIDGALSANPNLRKALWIRNGSLIIKGSVVIPSLTEGTTANSQYCVPTNGALILDGADVVVLETADNYQEVNTSYGVSAPDNATIGITAGLYNSFYIFGKLQVNQGYLSTRESGGLVTDALGSGILDINGGVVDAKQFLSATGSSAYNQTGGLLILRGRFQRSPIAYTGISDLTNVTTATLNTFRVVNGVNSGYGTFNLENTANVFSMSGGTIRIYDVTDATNQEAFDIKSSIANINVTGGTLEIIPTTGTNLADAANFYINTTASLGSIVLSRPSSTSVVQLNTNPFVLLNDLTINSGVLNANNLNVSVGGNITFESGTTYTPGSNTTTLNGSGSQTFTVNLASALALNNFTIDKPAGTNLTFAGSQKTINVTGNFRLVSANLNDNGNTIYLNSGVYNSGIHSGTGKISLNGTAVQTIDGNGQFGNLELFNTNAAAAPISLVDNTTIDGVLTFSNDKLFNISTYNLKLNASASIANYSSSRYIQTAGNAGDGGVTKVYSSITPFLFPVGSTSTRHTTAPVYAPATLGFTSAPATYGSITVNPVGYEHPSTTDTPGGNSLSYFWRIKSSGFTGIVANSVTHQFIYDNSDEPVAGDASFIPTLYNRTTSTWNNGTAADPPINTTTNTFVDWTTTGDSRNTIDADYTAGPATAFGTVRVFYSRINGASAGSGLWSNSNNWSFTSHAGSADTGGAVPGANDIVIIGGLDSVYLATNNTTPNTDVRSCASLQIEVGSALDIGYNPNCNFGMVLTHANGNGNFRLTTSWTSGSTFTFPSGDFTDYNKNLGTTELYSTNPAAGTTYWLPNGVVSYGNLILSPLGGSNIIFPNNNLTIYGNLLTRGQNSDSWFCPTWNTAYPTAPTAVVAKTITIQGDLRIEGGALIWYGNGALAQNFVIYGDLFINQPAGLRVYGSATNQSISIGGSLINNSLVPAGAPNDYRGANFTNIPLTFFGNTDELITNTNTGQDPYTVFSRVTVNKGSSQTTTLTCNIGGTQTTTPADNWLTLQNGTFIYQRTGNFTISTTTDFTIPPTAGLTLNTASNVYLSNNATTETVYLNGKLTVMNGNVYIGPSGNTANNADIEYSGGGNSEIEVSGGNLFVNGQIRRASSTTNGILKYTQSGGNVTIYGNNALATKAKLEVLNSGSAFNMSGGTLSIVRGGGTTFGDVYLRPESSTVTGGTIVFSPVATTTIDAAQNYLLDASVPLFNVTVTGKTAATARIATLGLNINPLVLGGNLTISNATYSVFNSNNLNVTINGNLTNNGAYNYGTNLTKFSGNTQTISGTAVTNFYDLEVAPISSLSVNSNFSVNRNLTISSGNLALSSYRLSLTGNLVNNGSYTDDNNTGGIRLSGTSQQQISGAGAYGRLELNNTNGARLNNSISLQNNLVLTSGILDINQYMLTLSQNSLIQGGTFSNTTMIKSDGVASNLGVRKFFPVITSLTSFTFPVGVSSKYTPATYSINANGTVGSISVVPINAYHPTVTYSDSVLNYYWKIESSGISGFTGNLYLDYNQVDVKGIESEYVAARLELPGDYWYKANAGPATDNVNESTNRITFTSGGSSNLSADYTAGSKTAIPDQVPSYVSNSDGNWNDVNIWTPVGTAPPCPAGGPNGAIVIVEHVVTTSTNYCSSYRLTVNGELKLVSPTYGHNLGAVDGTTGTIYLESGNLPAGNYTEFLDCGTDNTLEYGGVGNYTNIASLYNSVPNLVFSGSGLRILYNKDLTICNRLVIDGPTLDNSVNNKKFTIGGSMEIYNSGAFLSGTGNAPASTVTFAGTSLQTIGGPTGDFTGTNAFNNLEINNSAGLTIGLNGNIQVKNNLLLTNGNINTSVTNTLTIVNTSNTAVVPNGGSTTSYINGPLIKQIVNGESFLYPIGKSSTKGHNFTLTSSAGSTMYWTSEYFTPNTTATSLNSPLVATNTLEYWGVTATSAVNGKVSIGWDAQSNLTAAMTQNGLIDMRVADYDGAFWNQIVSTATGSLAVGEVSTTNDVSFSTTQKNFTTASITTTKPSARLAPTGPVCGNAGIPVVFTSFTAISLNYTIYYTIDGVAQTPIVVTALPFVLPTPSQGAYQLTGFKYNNSTLDGIVDATAVNAYTNPTTANAGSDQSLCGLSGTNLTGNSASPYTGAWTILSGSGGTIVNANSATSVFTGILDEVYNLRWTISNSTCTSSDDVQIAFNIAPAQPSNFTAAPTPVCAESSGNLYTVPNIAGVTYNWTYSGSGATITSSSINSASYAFNSTATSGNVIVTATNGCGTSTARTVAITVNPRGTWLGGTSTDWFDARNWTCPGIPLSTSDVVISAGATYMPSISALGAVCHGLTISNGATLTITGSNGLDIYGDLINNGTFTLSNTSTVTMAGTTTISGSSTNAFGNLIVNGTLTAPAGNMDIAGNFTVNGTFNHGNGTINFAGTTQTLTGPASVLTLNNVTVALGSTVSVSSGSKITLSGPLTVTGTLILKSDNTGTASVIDNGTINQTGTVTVERFITGNNWHLIFPSLSQVPTTTFTAEGASTNKNLYSSNEPNMDYWNATTVYGTTGWTAEYNSTNLRTDKGLMFNRYHMADKTYVQTGGNLFTGNKVFNISYTNHTGNPIGNGITQGWNYFDGWNLVGNPYTSAIDWDLVDKTNVENVVYIYDDTQDKYAYYGVDNYSGIGLSVNSATKYIPAGQGFMVKATTSGTFTLRNSDRTHSSQAFYKSAVATNNILRIQISQNGYSDEALVRTLPSESGVTDGHDSKYDAYKMFAWDKTKPQIYTENPGQTNLFAINSMEEVSAGKIIPLCVYAGTAGEHTIHFLENSFKNVHVYLEDKVVNPGNLVNIRNTNNYTFNQNVENNTTRFALHFNENHQPVANGSLENQTIYVGDNFNYTANVSFSDEDLGDTVSVNAEFPAWLSYDVKSGTFNGTPSANNLGTFTVRLVGTDILNAKTEVSFTVTVLNVNHVPILQNSIPDQEVNENELYSYIIPGNIFADVDLNDSLTISLQLLDGSELPAWLMFNSESSSISGIAQYPGDLNIVVKATDKYGLFVTDDYKLTIKSTTGFENQSFENTGIYPNPSKGIFFIENQNNIENFDISIRDMDGKLIKQLKSVGRKTEVKLDNLSDGVYFVELRKEQIVKVFKLILKK